MLHWLKQLRVAPVNCTNCPDLEARITFLEQQLDEYRNRLKEAEKLSRFIDETIARTSADTQRLFKQLGAINDSAHEVWQCATTLHTAISRIKDAQDDVSGKLYISTTTTTEAPSSN